MATIRSRFIDRDDVERCNRRLERTLPVSIQVYKSIMAATRLVGLIAGFFMILYRPSTDPMTVFLIMAVMISGPDLIDYGLSKGYRDEGGGGG